MKWGGGDHEHYKSETRGLDKRTQWEKHGSKEERRRNGCIA